MILTGEEKEQICKALEVSFNDEMKFIHARTHHQMDNWQNCGHCINRMKWIKSAFIHEMENMER